MTNPFTAQQAKPGKRPLFVGLSGPSGGGKTYSALELATGITEITGGRIYYIDTESGRALHYAEMFDFMHVPFHAPYSSARYLEAIQYCEEQKAGVIVVDSMSHEHEGEGGMLNLHEQEVDRMSKGDPAKAERVKMLAWQKPKAERRRMIFGILKTSTPIIFCFRAKNSTKPQKVNGRTELVQMGFTPITAEEMVFEMTVNCLLLPAADGVPTWQSEEKGEAQMIKLPQQFRELFVKRESLSREHGKSLAHWALGEGADQGGEKVDQTALMDAAKAAAGKGVEAFREHWRKLDKSKQAALKSSIDELQAIADEADKPADAEPPKEEPAEPMAADDQIEAIKTKMLDAAIGEGKVFAYAGIKHWNDLTAKGAFALLENFDAVAGGK